MDVHDLPARRLTMKCERSPANRITVPVELERQDGRISIRLGANIPGYDMEIRRSARLPARRREYPLEPLLDLLTTVDPIQVSRFRDVGIEDRHVVGKGASERLPTEIVERGNEAAERPLHLLLRIVIRRGGFIAKAYERDE